MTDFVHRLNDFAPIWAAAMWRAVWQGGLVIAIVWALCTALPRIPARVRCWLWRLAFAKLLICLVWGSPIKLALLPAVKPSTPPASVNAQVQIAQLPPAIPSPTTVQPLQAAIQPSQPVIAKSNISRKVIL